MTNDIIFAKRRLRGPQYSLEEFAEAYNLPEPEATRLFKLSGPGRVDLDMLMRVKTLKAASPSQPVFQRLDWVEALGPTASAGAD
ncbi:hypothetical protein LJR030_002960 [Rhizobium sp. LjRoot30]|uniref:hypothetical protein n=1 Tax=Rhizobium sp. LjRoot30 TaxID=3342320 RepID=UPI003ECEB5CD